MDIGTNELTRPFRIPRRRAGENSAADGVPDKVGIPCHISLLFTEYSFLFEPLAVVHRYGKMCELN